MTTLVSSVPQPHHDPRRDSGVKVAQGISRRAGIRAQECLADHDLFGAKSWQRMRLVVGRVAALIRDGKVSASVILMDDTRRNRPVTDFTTELLSRLPAGVAEELFDDDPAGDVQAAARA
jgi:hypothetical protein